MILYKIEERGRVNCKKIIKNYFSENSQLVMMNVGNHFSVFTKENFEQYVKNVAEETKLNSREVALYFSGKARDLKIDENYRMYFTKSERDEFFQEERNIYILPIELGGVKSLEIYPKSVYENLMQDIENTIDVCYKGKGYEEGRRKD